MLASTACATHCRFSFLKSQNLTRVLRATSHFCSSTSFPAWKYSRPCRDDTHPENNANSGGDSSSSSSRRRNLRWSSSEGNMDVDRGQIAKAIQKAKYARTCRHKRCSHKHPYRPTASIGRAEAWRIPVVRQVAGLRIWPELSLHLTGKHRLQHHERTSLFLPSIMRGECSSKAKSRASDFLRRQWCSMMIWWSWWGGAHEKRVQGYQRAHLESCCPMDYQEI